MRTHPEFEAILALSRQLSDKLDRFIATKVSFNATVAGTVTVARLAWLQRVLGDILYEAQHKEEEK